MQVFGAMSLSPDTPLARLWAWGRALRGGKDAVDGGAVQRLRQESAAAVAGVQQGGQRFVGGRCPGRCGGGRGCVR